MKISFTDYRKYPALYAKKLGVTQSALDLYFESEIIDPHTVSYIWKRIFGYDLTKKHSYNLFGIPFLSQVDFPRALEANMAGVVWDISTNPLHKDKNKLEVIRRNIDTVMEDLDKASDSFQFVRTYSDYQEARKNNKVASFISIQGGQAVDNNISNLDKIPEVHRITLIHFTKSKIGASNFDTKNKDIGLSTFGKSFVEKMVEKKIMVDLSHINKKGFFEALDIVPKDIPVAVTHTGVSGVYEIWRNIDDEQIKAIANTGGTVGVIYCPRFLTNTATTCSVDKIIDHFAHIIKVAGEDVPTLGSDYDGLINLPTGFKDITYQPILVQKMLDRGWSAERIKKILGLNFLRVIKGVSP